MCRVASAPNPVEMPYDGVGAAASSSTTPRARSMAASAAGSRRTGGAAAGDREHVLDGERAGADGDGRAGSGAWSWPHPTPAAGRRPVRRPPGRLGMRDARMGFLTGQQAGRRPPGRARVSLTGPMTSVRAARPAAGRGRRRPPLDDARGEHAGAGGGRGDGARAGLPDPGAARPPGTLAGAGRAGGRGPDRRGDAHPGGVGRGDRPPRRAVRAGDRPGRHHRGRGAGRPGRRRHPGRSR